MLQMATPRETISGSVASLQGAAASVSSRSVGCGEGAGITGVGKGQAVEMREGGDAPSLTPTRLLCSCSSLLSFSCTFEGGRDDADTEAGPPGGHRGPSLKLSLMRSCLPRLG